MSGDGFPFEIPITVHWGDMDSLGHVNNARYFTWFESARMALFEAAGLMAEAKPVIGPILAHTRCDFLAPVSYPAEVVAGTRVSRLGNTSFGMEYAVWHAEAGPRKPVARGEGVVVMVNYDTGATVPIPEELREALRRYL